MPPNGSLASAMALVGSGRVPLRELGQDRKSTGGFLPL